MHDCLSPEQREVVLHTGSPAIVLAGAGSGKTHTLGYRIKHLIEQGTDPREILAVTFSKKAAEELEARISEKLGLKGVRIGTFHSIGNSLLREFIQYTPYKPGFSLIKDWQRKSFLSAFVEDSTDLTETDWSVYATQISAAKKELMSSEDIYANFGADTDKAFKYYEYKKVSENLIDFDDMIYWPAKLIRENSTVRSATKNRFVYGLVDEAQDNNRMQFEMAKHLVCPDGMMIIGDDFQSIYAFQGARPDLTIFDYMEKSGAKVFLLKDNYRSAAEVVQIANKLSDLMDAPIKKQMNVKKEDTGVLSVFRSEDPDDEARELITKIAFEKGNYRWNDFAVLYRTNAQSRALEEALIARDIPYVIYGGFPFFNRKEVKDILAYMKLSVDPIKYSSEIGRVINIASNSYPTRTRKLGKKFVDDLFKQKKAAWMTLQQSPYDKRVKDFLQFVAAISKQKSPAEKVAHILDNCYFKFLQQEEGMNKDSDDDTVALLEEIRSIFSKFDTCEKLFAHCAKMQSTTKDEEKRKEDAVQLMTIHKSKGLEWQNVSVISLNNNILPHKKAETEEAFKEERRIAYVAVTRAIKNLTVSFVANFRNRPVMPSVFIAEMGLSASSAIEQHEEKLQENKELSGGSIFSGD
jgi:superfamily I DNA/RNA helicase